MMSYIIQSSSIFIFGLAFAAAQLLDLEEPKLVYSKVRGLGYEYPRYAYPESSVKLSPRWLIAGGRNIIPGSIYRVAVQALNGIPGEETPLTIRAAITQNERQIAFGKVLIHPGELSHILLQVPDTSVQGLWQLNIEGREGMSQLPVFKNTTTLKFSPNFLTILIQTSRPIYNAGQTVRFRGVLLTRELKPYEEPIDVYVIDPRGRVMRRWPSRQTGDGIVNQSFDLPNYPETGTWTIQVQARQQIQNKTIVVEQYFRPRFEVFVRLPHTFKVTDSVIEGVVVANMTNWRDVHGNCSVKLQIAENDESPIPTSFETVHSEFIHNFTGSYSFRLPMYAVSSRATTLSGVVIRVLASVGDAFGWRIHDGWALARIVQEEAKVTFLGDQLLFFKPGMPVAVHVFVSYDDDHPLGKEQLEFAELTVTFRTTTTVIITVNGTELTESGGVAYCTALVPEDSNTLEVSARFINNYSLSAAATLVGITHHSPRSHFLQIDTSTPKAFPGEYIVLHVRSNFYISHINYLVIANGLVVYTGREAVNEISFPTVVTFSLAASAEMSPVAKILIWVVDNFSEVVAHSIAIPIDPLSRNEVNIVWNTHKDHSGGSAEVKMIGEVGTSFSASAVWEETYLMDSGYDLDAARILHHMMGFHDNEKQASEDIIPHIRRASTRSRDGFGSQVRFFPTANAGPDAPSTFNFSEVFLLTDAMVYYHPSKATDAPLCEEDSLPCLTGGCYLAVQRCDGDPNCADFSDESGCPLDIDPLRNFRLYRMSRLNRLYDADSGDWAWKEVRGETDEIEIFEIPKRPQNWIFSVFALGYKRGIGILTNRIQFDSARPFMLTVDAPKLCRMWEQVALTVGLFNFHSNTIAVLLTLPFSDDYQTFVVEKNGVVESYNPRKLNGTFQHVVWLPPGASVDVNIPVVFKRLGEIELTIYGKSQLHMDSVTVGFEVIIEGAYIVQHTSGLFDLKNRALAYEFFDIHIDETPIIPYQLERRYIFGTPEGHVSITGDVIGPMVDGLPTSEDSMTEFGVMGCETSVFNFAINVWYLHYLRLTNQITAELTYDILTAANTEYAQISRYQALSGGFSNYIGSEESVWLTAHVLKNLWIATFQDWENFIFIDTKIIRSGVSFLLEYQTKYGSFMETEEYHHPLDPKVDPRSRHEWLPKYQNISLTAQVVIALVDVLPALEGELHRKANLAKQKARTYLENVLAVVSDPYDLVHVTWALFKADSEERDYAFNVLDKMKWIDGDKVYWSKEKIIFNEIIYEDSQRPYIQPKPDNVFDTHAVEATSYALLVYIKADGIGIVQENIVRFLACMRKADGGLDTTTDTLVAMEALVQYSFRARIRDVTDMHVHVEQSADQNSSIDAYITNSPGMLAEQRFDLDNIFGHLNIIGRGSGQALLQLHYTYGVDIPDELDYPEAPSYNFELTARFFGKNNSYVEVTACQSWINLEEGETSGLTVVDIYMPTGYYIMQDELIALVESRKVRNLRWAEVKVENVVFYFNRMDNETICFTYTLERWFPVSNHSRFNAAMIYELYQPERFEMVFFEVYPLYSLDICEVCGSYQCPYCPFYSESSVVLPEKLFLTTSIVFSTIFFHFIYHIR